MNGVRAIHRLQEIQFTEKEEMKHLAERILSESREASEAVVGTWLTADKGLACNALFVMMELKELALQAILRHMDSATVAQRKVLIETAVEALRSLRRRVLVQLDHLLNDSSPVIISDEDKPGSNHRMCDEAYLLMRKLLNDASKDQKAYFKMNTLQRDAEIEKWKLSTSRRCLIGERVK
jgi:hypothetical protein